MSVEIESIGDGIHEVTLPLPFTMPRSINCYFIEGTDGLTLIDVGVADDRTIDALLEAAERLGGGRDALRRVIGTHLHPDHMGSASVICARSGATFVMHESTAQHVPGYNDWNIHRHLIADLAEANGADPDSLAILRGDNARPDWAGTAVDPDRPVGDLDRLELGDGRYLEVLHTPGHHPTHIALRDSRTGRLFSGDHVLPRITPFIPFSEEEDNLGHYLDSIERVELLDPGITLPAHGGTIEQGRARARQIALHHERRFGAMLQEVRTAPKTAWEVMAAVFRPDLSPQDKYLAFQETMAHLEHLVRAKRVRRFEEDGVWYYRR